jgi:AcrR family transcriptional regulator
VQPVAGTERSTDAVRPVGRPPRISRQTIAQAAHELGLDGLTLRAVAEHLDVSIAALYHHVSGKDDLMRLAAEYSAASVPIPQDTGQHWAVWLQEWASYNHDIFLARPALLAQYLEGAIPMETIAANVDRILGVMVRQGFGVLEANAAYEEVTAIALGSAVMTTRERAAVESGASLRAAHQAVVASHPDHDLPYLESLLVEIPLVGRRTLRDRVTTALRGIASERGIDWATVEGELDSPQP